MKALIYAGSEFLTSDAIAAALLEYGAALAEGRTGATVEIPIVDSAGTVTTAVFLVGPASQIVAREVVTDLAEPDHLEVVEHLEALTRRLHPTARADTETPPDMDWSWES